MPATIALTDMICSNSVMTASPVGVISLFSQEYLSDQVKKIYIFNQRLNPADPRLWPVAL
jgi:hypothetical protein